VVPRSEDPKLIIRIIIFELVQPICPRYINVTDKKTDGKTTYDSNTALCTTCIALTVSQHLGHAMFSDINISRGSVATPSRYGGTCSDFIANFLASVAASKIGQYLAKLWTRVWCLF